MRSWAEGLELSASWGRYLRSDEARDGRAARRELRRLLDELGSRARALGRADLAALLRRDPEAMASASPALPSLDEFRETLPADLYGEAELLALYRERFGSEDARSPARRRQRLRVRLLEALAWLEAQDARPPQRGDPIADWLDERLAARLAVAGLVGLGELMDHIAAHGRRWHRGVPQLGVVGARRVLGWLRSHEASLGLLPADAPPAGGMDDASASLTRIAPLERWSPPPALDGSQGRHRAPADRCFLTARNDREAVEAWLAQWPQGSHTWRAYRKEAERLLLWAVLVRGRALSSLEPADLEAYAAFLSAPPAGWTAPRNAARSSPAWRPFEGPLAARSQARATAALRSLFGWLVRQGYLVDDALAAPASHRPAGPAVGSPLRALPPSLWAHLLRWVDARPTGPERRRLRFVLRLAHATGMRLSELVAARIGWLHASAVGRRVVWSIGIQRPGAAPRELPLPGGVVESFREVLTDRGLTLENSSSAAESPLVARLDGRGGMSPSGLYESLAAAFTRCADDLEPTDAAGAAELRRASTHWLRHGHGIAAAAAGVRPGKLQQALGHRRPGSVSVYFRRRETAGLRPKRRHGIRNEMETFREPLSR